MLIGGFQKNSFIDFPGVISSVIFTRGCNFQCFYCHNPELIISTKKTIGYPQKKIMDYLTERAGKLQGVVITGGEPTLHKDLPDLITEIKSLGYKVKLDTNGTNSSIISKLIEKRLIDYVAMDIKAPLELNKYRTIVGPDFKDSMLTNIKETIRTLWKTLTSSMSSGQQPALNTSVSMILKPLSKKHNLFINLQFKILSLTLY